MTRFKLNGEQIALDIPADMPLLWVLRDLLHLQGTKYGCGIGACGACTVNLNGHAVRACRIDAVTLEGADVMTIEGMVKLRHPLHRAWQDVQPAQCGYCQPGQLMSALALLNRNPHPSDMEIDAAMAGNLCRCASYSRIRLAIHSAVDSAIKLESGYE